mmetsp:Transcript_25644/g.38492  ORF Transcript_25644/g.38492 Transcript_25644/m.38492 type:complete len:416 (-) Transcript_25644:687-1934(-)
MQHRMKTYISALALLWWFIPGYTTPFAMSSPTNKRNTETTRLSSKTKQTKLSSSSNAEDDTTSAGENDQRMIEFGKLEALKRREAVLARLLADVRNEKLSALRDRPLTIGVVGFGRFGQFIAKTFAKYGRVVATSRSDYTAIANKMNVTYVPLSDPEAFLAEKLDVIVLAVSILSFDSTVRDFAKYLKADSERRAKEMGGISLPGPLVVDVLSVKEHPRQVMLDLLPPDCDILCTHPMFGPDSGANGWHGLNFVYERTRIDGVILDPSAAEADKDDSDRESFRDSVGQVHYVHENNDAHVEGMDRMERFLSIWEEEGCNMVPMSCHAHDDYAANSQFITHLMGRILGSQGLKPTPIDTKGFESVLKLVGTTTADSFDLFYGLYKYNQNSENIIAKLRGALDDVVDNLVEFEKKDK